MKIFTQLMEKMYIVLYNQIKITKRKLYKWVLIRTQNKLDSIKQDCLLNKIIHFEYKQLNAIYNSNMDG